MYSNTVKHITILESKMIWSAMIPPRLIYLLEDTITDYIFFAQK